MSRYDRTGDRLEDTEEPQTLSEVNSAGLAECRAALAAADAIRSCPVCGGRMKPGWLVHPGCRRAAG